MATSEKLPYSRPQVFRHDPEADRVDWIQEAVNEIRRTEGFGPAGHDKNRPGLAPAAGVGKPMLARRQAN